MALGYLIGKNLTPYAFLYVSIFHYKSRHIKLFHARISSSDIGGYTTAYGIATRSKELLLRWAEYSVFTPVMRTHEGNLPDINHQVYSDDDTMKKFGRLTNIYNALYEVRIEAVRSNYEEGE